MSNKIKDLADSFEKRLNDLMEKTKSEAATLMQEMVDELFAKWPKLNSFEYKAYTVYFNDGDECYYGVHAEDYGLSINGMCDDSLPHIGWGSKSWNYGEFETEEEIIDAFGKNWKDFLEKVPEEIGTIVYSIPNDVHKSMFGDHKQITVTRDGITTEDYYDHD